MTQEPIRYYSNKNIKTALKSIFQAIQDLKNLKESRHFTIDGRLVGDIGEIIAELDYTLKLTENMQPLYDAVSDADGRQIQIKATFKNTLGFMKAYADNDVHYLGLKLYPDGSYEEVFNGPSKLIYEACNPENKTLQSGKLIALGVSKLRCIELPSGSIRIARRKISHDI